MKNMRKKGKEMTIQIERVYTKILSSSFEKHNSNMTGLRVLVEEAKRWT